ncbi:MAG: azurin [Pseudoxanthomonas sp.]
MHHPKEHVLKIVQRALLAVLLVAGAPATWAKTCTVAIAGNDQMKFDKTEIAVAGDCTEVKLVLKHTGKLAANIMGHNWVLARTADFQPLANDAVKSKLEDDYLPKGDARVIAHTQVIGGGQETSVTFPTGKLEKGGDYTFFCSFPGHFTMMKGVFKFG